MKVGKTLYVKTRKEWREWLEKNHKTELEIWLVYYRKTTGKPRISYNDAVEEALCFGWIDSIEKGIDAERFAQRFTPRRPKSQWSETNKERVRRLIKLGKMVPAGLALAPFGTRFSHVGSIDLDSFKIAADIERTLKNNPEVWKNFQRFPESYKRIRIGWIEGARKRPEVFKQRLNYFLKMTAKNKQFGMVK